MRLPWSAATGPRVHRPSYAVADRRGRDAGHPDLLGYVVADRRDPAVSAGLGWRVAPRQSGCDPVDSRTSPAGWARLPDAGGDQDGRTPRAVTVGHRR